MLLLLYFSLETNFVKIMINRGSTINLTKWRTLKAVGCCKRGLCSSEINNTLDSCLSALYLSEPWIIKIQKRSKILSSQFKIIALHHLSIPILAHVHFNSCKLCKASYARTFELLQHAIFHSLTSEPAKMTTL